MNRNKRLLILAVAALPAAALLPNWSLSAADLGPETPGLALLALACLAHFASPLRPRELAVLALLLAPAGISAFHFLCALPLSGACAAAGKCLLALGLFALLAHILSSLLNGALQTAARLALSLSFPAFAALWLLGQSFLFLVSLPLAGGLLWHYLRSVKGEGG